MESKLLYFFTGYKIFEDLKSEVKENTIVVINLNIIVMRILFYLFVSRKLIEFWKYMYNKLMNL
jgi:hypothetical protein